MRRVLAKFPHWLSCVNIPLFASGGKFGAGFPLPVNLDAGGLAKPFPPPGAGEAS